MWSAPHDIAIVIEGEAADRRAADRYREALVGAEEYIVSSAGAESEGGKRLAYGFTYKLATTVRSPSEAEPPAASAVASTGGGGEGGK